ncbi:hypothetical protein [Desulfoscipio geothermicus]|uniref:Uncharacterized protein n=1 Tax=Desulfoscipio geothermicus DSM 3669 TaxID=1121426 RepID=A0A1I6E9Z3_9FIRM|nr:hypothetical protein [Desulfoscipio geothermicus]SFR14554.1 hypothetical protein SAMN05660706_13215 [Desulfoscipio geothermicus DSM 3669]
MPGEITLHGVTAPRGMQFTVSGNFRVAPGGKNIIFQPTSITVGQNTLDQQVLDYISYQHPLAWDITKNFPMLSISNLTTDNRKIIISLNS